MSIVLLDHMAPEAVDWLRERFTVHSRAAEPYDPANGGLAREIAQARAVILPPEFRVTQNFLATAPNLEILGRVRSGTGNTDLNACEARGVIVLNSSRASVHSNAEFSLAGLLAQARPDMWGGLSSMVSGAKPHEVTGRIGRELYGSTVAMFGLAPLVHALAPMLLALGVRLIGYDPAVHRNSSLWTSLRITPMALPDMLATADAVCVQMLFASRFRGLVNENLLRSVKPGQIWVSISRSGLFDEAALAQALVDGRIASCLLDGAEGDFADPSSPLNGLPNLFLTPRLGSRTVQAVAKASWYLAHRVEQVLQSDSDFQLPEDDPPTRPPELVLDDDGPDSSIPVLSPQLPSKPYRSPSGLP